MALVMNLIITLVEKINLKIILQVFQTWKIQRKNLPQICFCSYMPNLDLSLYHYFTSSLKLEAWEISWIRFPSFFPFIAPSKQSPKVIHFHLSVSPWPPQALSSPLHYYENCQLLDLHCLQLPHYFVNDLFKTNLTSLSLKTLQWLLIAYLIEVQSFYNYFNDSPHPLSLLLLLAVYIE